MVKLKIRSLWFLAAFLFLSTVPTVAEVVKEVSQCKGFLLEETPPEIPGILEGGKILNQNQYKPICQTYNNKPRFLTLYDTKNRIPVFSAYKYRGKGEGKRPQQEPWKIEPQLEKEGASKNMANDEGVINKKQASDADYNNNQGYNRGHLFPSSHAYDQDDKKSTFTLTNVVPQAISFNNGSWARMETCVKCVMDKYCNDNNGNIAGFVVVGAIPSPEDKNNPNNNKLNGRVNIPSQLWSAFCCYRGNTNEWIASSFWGDNVADKTDKKGKKDKQHMETRTLKKLTEDLKINAFPNSKCPLDTTVAELYPDIVRQNCDCPTTNALLISSSAPFTPTSVLLASTLGVSLILYTTTPLPPFSFKLQSEQIISILLYYTFSVVSFVTMIGHWMSVL